jgi:hypothetical protein
MKIKILKQNKDIMWYNSHVGMIFQVQKEDSEFYWCRELDNFNSLNIVHKEDAEITEEP